MKKIFASLTTLLCIMLPNVGASLTGAELKEMCATDDSANSDSTACLYFILAAREALVWGAQISGYRTRPEGQSTSDVMFQAKLDLGICIPSDTSNRTAINRILNYIKIVDVSDDKTATLLVYDALKLSYPCE